MWVRSTAIRFTEHVGDFEKAPLGPVSMHTAQGGTVQMRMGDGTTWELSPQDMLISLYDQLGVQPPESTAQVRVV